MLDGKFYQQAKLILKVLPYLYKHDCFAIKGGTAINYFLRDLPRLSVDIDICYLPINGRDIAFQNIAEHLRSISKQISIIHPELRIINRKTKNNILYGLFISDGKVVIKIESNLIIRGTVFPVIKKELCDVAQTKFELTQYAHILSLADLFGGKICAALDRQHPRDLFDIQILLKNEGISDDTRKAFIVYLISHHRPIAELLEPNLKNIEDVFYSEFIGMTDTNVTSKNLSETLRSLVLILKKSLTNEERLFLISFKKIQPEWTLLGLDNIEHLPAVNWKLNNLARMEKGKHQKAVDKLKKVLKI
ncbi:MAG: nucleotidyl transferase AbiEii/AbiGii toxin family protein [Candidatus Cloacimonetes bacterium]|nr:nucleotidyl transferase AbiEii/AbiGii toxin family protein [Candidatus Cloacimonadota bacterium]